MTKFIKFPIATVVPVKYQHEASYRHPTFLYFQEKYS